MALLALAPVVHAQDVWNDPRFRPAHELDSLGKHERSLELLRKLAQDPVLKAAALNNMADCEFHHLRRADEAFVHIQEAITADPKNPVHYLDRSTMYQDMGMPDRSLDDLLAARPLADTLPMQASIELNIGAAYIQTRRFPEALQQFDRVLAMDSTDAAAMLNKANVLDELHRRDEALTLLQKLVASEPENTAYLNNIGFLLSNMDRHAEAITWYDRSLAIAKDDGYTLNNRGYAKLRTGDTDGALKDVQRSIKVQPGNSYAYRNLGLVFQARGEQAKACEAFEAALARGYTKQYGPDVKQAYDSQCR